MQREDECRAELAFTDFGEATQAFLSDWPERVSPRVSVYDSKLRQAGAAVQMQARDAAAAAPGEKALMPRLDARLAKP